ncbi:alpha/beta hydrolase [Amycolatopsis anabasis]|uniref:alpha/beta hydrolase n=1 Tax=Amycolatopsis anabasis TaxID=1840409 RepID=UPI00131E2DAC|nr:alpha/beta hydrolase [Amycolatopsis anabasis]
MPLEPASEAFLAELATAGMPPIEDWTPSIVRLGDPVLAGLTGPGPEVGAVRDFRLTAADGDFRVRILRPAAPARATIVYFHGGGWVGGDIDLQYDHVGRDLTNATRSTVVLVNYRKAPEHPFPTAIEDSWLALRWAADHATELAPSGAPLLVAGDSAGGNIAAVLTQRARDAAGPRIDRQVLVYPVTDCDLTRPSYVDPENQRFLDRDTMAWYWHHYLPDETARRQPAASPLRAESLAGLPPALIYVAEYDPLRDEGVAYADALRAAGVPVVLAEAKGQMHGFFQMANILPGYDEGLRLVAGYVNDFLSADDKDLARA